jgi:hypothetical protein
VLKILDQPLQQSATRRTPASLRKKPGTLTTEVPAVGV